MSGWLSILNVAMAMRSRRSLFVVAVLAALVLALAVGWQFALRRLHGAVLDALGPRASVAALEVGLGGVTVRGLRIAADRSGRAPWPATDELRAERVTLVPDWRSAFGALGGGGAWRLQAVRVEGAYLSLLRTREGKLRVLPALLERPPEPAPRTAAASAPQEAATALLVIADLRLDEAVVELYDASVRQPAHLLRLEQLQATLADIAVPGFDGRMPVRLEGVFKGAQRDGRVQIEGWLGLAQRDAELKAKFSGVDLIALQPYLLKVAEGGVKRGTLDLALAATVKKNHLSAPGQVTLTGLELNSGGSFAGVPRQAVIAAMSRNGRIQLKFTLAGRLDDPGFSLNENFASKVGAGLAEALGVSVGGVVEGVGSLIKGLFGR